MLQHGVHHQRLATEGSTWRVHEHHRRILDEARRRACRVVALRPQIGPYTHLRRVEWQEVKLGPGERSKFEPTRTWKVALPLIRWRPSSKTGDVQKLHSLRSSALMATAFGVVSLTCDSKGNATVTGG